YKYSDLHVMLFIVTRTTEIYTLSLHDALPILSVSNKGPERKDLICKYLSINWASPWVMGINLSLALFPKTFRVRADKSTSSTCNPISSERRIPVPYKISITNWSRRPDADSSKPTTLNNNSMPFSSTNSGILPGFFKDFSSREGSFSIRFLRFKNL